MNVSAAGVMTVVAITGTSVSTLSSLCLILLEGWSLFSLQSVSTFFTLTLAFAVGGALAVLFLIPLATCLRPTCLVASVSFCSCV